MFFVVSAFSPSVSFPVYYVLIAALFADSDHKQYAPPPKKKKN